MRVAYLSMQAIAEGQDSWAAVNEIVSAWRTAGWDVDLYFPTYRGDHPGGITRVYEMLRVQRTLTDRIHEYDVLYVRGHMMAYLAAAAARRSGVPTVQECNGTYEDLFVAWPTTRIARPLFEHMQRVQYRWADLIFCGTDEQRRWLQGEAAHDRIIVSPNGANSSIFHPAARVRDGLPERYVLFFGQFAPWQGIEVLLRAREQAAWPRDVKLVFVGDGHDRPLVERAVAGSDGGVLYLGRLPYDELAGVIAPALASTSPQYTEDRGEAGFSALKLYETMACGVPVIGSDYPGVGDVIRRYGAGIVVTPGDAVELAEAVARLADNPDEAAEMGRRGREAIEREASWAARADQRREAIERLGTGRRSGR